MSPTRQRGILWTHRSTSDLGRKFTRLSSAAFQFGGHLIRWTAGLSCIKKRENKRGPLHVQHLAEGEVASRGVDVSSASIEVTELTEYFEGDLKIIVLKKANILKWCLWLFSQPSNTCLRAEFTDKEMSSRG